MYPFKIYSAGERINEKNVIEKKSKNQLNIFYTSFYFLFYYNRASIIRVFCVCLDIQYFFNFSNLPLETVEALTKSFYKTLM